MQPHSDSNQHTPAAAAVADSTLTTIAATVLVGLSVRQQLVELYEHQLSVTITYLLESCSSTSEKIDLLAREEATLHGNRPPTLHASAIPSLCRVPVRAHTACCSRPTMPSAKQVPCAITSKRSRAPSRAQNGLRIDGARRTCERQRSPCSV